jgi:hypothetical protein
MLSAKPLLPQTSRHINIYDEDWDYIGRAYAAYAPYITVGQIIRQVTHNYTIYLRKRERELLAESKSASLSSQLPTIPAMPEEEISIDEIYSAK